MGKMIRSLFWKEWREQRWKLAFGCVLLAGYTAIGLNARLLPDEVIIVFGLLIGVFLLPLLASMDIVAAERAEGSMDTLLALPIGPRIVFAIKTAMGVATCGLPIVAAALVACVLAGGRELAVSRIIFMHGTSVLLALTVFIWMLAFTVRQPTEARAGLVGIGVLAGLAVWGMAADEIILCSPTWALHPFRFWNLMEGGESGLEIIMIQSTLAIFLWFWSVHRFARPGRTRA